MLTDPQARRAAQTNPRYTDVDGWFGRPVDDSPGPEPLSFEPADETGPLALVSVVPASAGEEIDEPARTPNPGGLSSWRARIAALLITALGFMLGSVATYLLISLTGLVGATFFVGFAIIGCGVIWAVAKR